MQSFAAMSLFLVFPLLLKKLYDIYSDKKKKYNERRKNVTSNNPPLSLKFTRTLFKMGEKNTHTIDFQALITQLESKDFKISTF